MEYLAQILNKNDVNLPRPNASPDKITQALNLVFVIMGALALLMLVIAGFRYTISQGDANDVANAKRMIIYTLIGLLVIALAATIVNFVLGKAK
jgi:uncharacterized membrane protein YidH (DUF202 family)